MARAQIKISGVGCSLLDYIYTKVDFTDEALNACYSKKAGDGGILPGNLVFSEDLERFTGESLGMILEKILPGGETAVSNIGGPCMVAMIHASQLLYDSPVHFSYFGAMGTDSTGEELAKLLEHTSLNLDAYQVIEGATPKTIVLSDPAYHNGQGERAFINTIGVAAHYGPEKLGQRFFDADILLFGGTALLPPIHDKLYELLKEGKRKGSVNIVTTVFDFLNENLAPNEKWPLGNSDKSFQYIDLLIMDQEEALRISGQKELGKAAGFFINQKTSSFIITRGADDILFYSDGTFFSPRPLASMPVLPIDSYRTPGLQCDTTGCGDNFAGGVLASLISQMSSGKEADFDPVEACSWGVVSGTYTGLITGGTEFEKKKGEKAEKIAKLFNDYKKRTGSA